MKKEHPEYFTKKPDLSTREGKLMWAYQTLNPQERKKWIKEQGLENTEKPNYDEIYKERREKRRRDEIINTEIEPKKAEYRKWVKDTYREKIKQGKKITFTERKKGLDKNVWKVK